MKDFLLNNYNLSIIAAVISIVQFALAYYIYRSRRLPCKIIFYPSPPVSLYNDVIDKFKSLEIKFNNKYVTNNLAYFTGSFICGGHKDIVYHDNMITLHFPENCKLLDIDISSKCEIENLSADIDSTSKNQATIRFSKLLVDENFKLNAILQCDKDFMDNYNERIAIGWRIPNTNVVFFHENKKNTFNSFYERIKVPSLVFAIICLILIYLFKDLPLVPKFISYFIIIEGLLIYLLLLGSFVIEKYNIMKRDRLIKIRNKYNFGLKRKFS